MKNKNLVRGVLLHYNTLKNSAELVEKVSHKHRMIDLFLSRLLLRVNYKDYLNLGFYDKSWSLRKKYIIDDLSPAVKYNNSNPKVYENKKCDWLERLRPFMHRKIFSTIGLSLEQLEQLAATGNSIFYKPSNGCGGEGIRKINLSEYQSVRELFEEIQTWPEGILEETIIQHPEMNRLCPTVVQDIRFCVFRHHDGPRILFTTLRSSQNPDSFVDNGSSGGIFANIDVATGRIRTNAFCELSCQKNIMGLNPKFFTDEGLALHPISGVPLKGFQIPYFQEAKRLVLDMVSQVNFEDKRLLGFDIAITSQGPEVIEVNTVRPGIVGLWQTACKSEPLKATLDRMFQE